LLQKSLKYIKIFPNGNNVGRRGRKNIKHYCSGILFIGDKMVIKDTKTLGKFIRETRKSQNLTQVMLAGSSGVGARFLIELENGKETASLGKTIRILNMLGINIDLKK